MAAIHHGAIAEQPDLEPCEISHPITCPVVEIASDNSYSGKQNTPHFRNCAQSANPSKIASFSSSDKTGVFSTNAAKPAGPRRTGGQFVGVSPSLRLRRKRTGIIVASSVGGLNLICRFE
jgi:hypothetical protein